VALLTSTAANDAAMYMAAKNASNFLNMKNSLDKGWEVGKAGRASLASAPMT
jgi:hypothetical protein